VNANALKKVFESRIGKQDMAERAVPLGGIHRDAFKLNTPKAFGCSISCAEAIRVGSCTCET
jgi:hypothetical protein